MFQLALLLNRLSRTEGADFLARKLQGTSKGTVLNQQYLYKAEPSCRGNISTAVFKAYPGKGSFFIDPRLAREEDKTEPGEHKLQRCGSMSLLIGRNWSWIGSCGGGGQAIETSFAQGTCVLGIETFSSSVGVTYATSEVVEAFSWVG